MGEHHTHKVVQWDMPAALGARSLPKGVAFTACRAFHEHKTAQRQRPWTRDQAEMLTMGAGQH